VGAARSLKGAEIQSRSEYGFFCQTLQPETRNLELDFLLVRLHSAYQGVRKAALDVHMVAVAVPREIIFL
jgi:hypothetical protein